MIETCSSHHVLSSTPQNKWCGETETFWQAALRQWEPTALPNPLFFHCILIPEFISLNRFPKEWLSTSASTLNSSGEISITCINNHKNPEAVLLRARRRPSCSLSQRQVVNELIRRALKNNQKLQHTPCLLDMFLTDDSYNVTQKHWLWYYGTRKILLRNNWLCRASPLIVGRIQGRLLGHVICAQKGPAIDLKHACHSYEFLVVLLLNLLFVNGDWINEWSRQQRQ